MNQKMKIPIYNFKLHNKTFHINYSSWIDAVNQLNYDMFKENKHYLIESCYETED